MLALKKKNVAFLSLLAISITLLFQQPSVAMTWAAEKSAAGDMSSYGIESPESPDQTVSIPEDVPVKLPPIRCNKKFQDSKSFSNAGCTETAPCASDQVRNQDGACVFLPCPAGQFRTQDGACKKAKKCSSRRVNGVDGGCYSPKCPRGTVRGPDLVDCVPVICPDNQAVDRSGKCAPKKIPKAPKTSAKASTRPCPENKPIRSPSGGCMAR